MKSFQEIDFAAIDAAIASMTPPEPPEPPPRAEKPEREFVRRTNVSVVQSNLPKAGSIDAEQFNSLYARERCRERKIELIAGFVGYDSRRSFADNELNAYSIMHMSKGVSTPQKPLAPASVEEIRNRAIAEFQRKREASEAKHKLYQEKLRRIEEDQLQALARKQATELQKRRDNFEKHLELMFEELSTLERELSEATSPESKKVLSGKVLIQQARIENYQEHNNPDRR